MVNASSQDDQFILKVTNRGDQIPNEVMERLFHPFSRGEVKPGQQGLGLGLFISSEIAKAHGGSIEVKSTGDETSFTLVMPVKC